MKEKWVLPNFTKYKTKTEEENVKLKGNNKGLEELEGQILQYNKVGKGNSFQYACPYRYAILAGMIRPLRIKFKGAVYHILHAYLSCEQPLSSTY